MGKKLNTGGVPGMCVLNNRNGTRNIGRPAFKSGAVCALTYVQVKCKYKLMQFCRFLYIDRQFVHHAAWTTNMNMQN